MTVRVRKSVERGGYCDFRDLVCVRATPLDQIHRQRSSAGKFSIFKPRLEQYVGENGQPPFQLGGQDIEGNGASVMVGACLEHGSQISERLRGGGLVSSAGALLQHPCGNERQAWLGA